MDHGLVGSSLAGVTRMATLSLTVVHTRWQSPQPTHRVLSTARRMSEKSNDNAPVGHWETQAWHPWLAVHKWCDTTASPILTSSRLATVTNASVAQAAMHGKSSQR